MVMSQKLMLSTNLSSQTKMLNWVHIECIFGRQRAPHKNEKLRGGLDAVKNDFSVNVVININSNHN